MDRANARASAPPLLPADPIARLRQGWDVCEPASGTSSNRDILTAITSGASAVILEGEDVGQRLDGVVLSAIHIVLQGQSDPLAAYDALLNLVAQDGCDAGSLVLDLGLGPSRDISHDMAALCRTAPETHRVFCLDGWSQHSLGLTTAQEIGFVLAGAAELFRAGAAHDLDVSIMASRMSARLALGPDLFAAITACRAMRRAWDGLLSACGAGPVALHLHGMTSLRMLSVLDEDVNMLRSTTALLGGAIGGADMLTGAGHNTLTGETSAARRLVRMTQLMLMAESNLATTLDPSAGAPFIESRTEDVAAAAWKAFQDIEAVGGLAVALASGMIDGWATAAAHARNDRLGRGADDLLGVTLQPKAEPVASPSAAFDHVRRPAARVEDLRRVAAFSPPRILNLLGDGDTAADEDRKLRQQLAIAGLQAVSLKVADATKLDRDIAAANPDILFGCGMAQPPQSTSTDEHSQYEFKSAAEFLARSDRLAALESLLPGSLLPESRLSGQGGKS